MMAEEKNENKARWFPLFQEITGKEALVIGGGKVAVRRVRALLRFDCHIHIVSPRLCAELSGLTAGNAAYISVEYRPFRPEDCTTRKNLFCVIAAASSRAVNQLAGHECRARGIPVSVADCKEESTFYFPAIVRDGPLTAALGSDGTDHRAVSKATEWLRMEIPRHREAL